MLYNCSCWKRIKAVAMSRTRNAVVGVIRHVGSNPTASAKCRVFHGFFFLRWNSSPQGVRPVGQTENVKHFLPLCAKNLPLATFLYVVAPPLPPKIAAHLCCYFLLNKFYLGHCFKNMHKKSKLFKLAFFLFCFFNLFADFSFAFKRTIIFYFFSKFFSIGNLIFC